MSTESTRTVREGCLWVRDAAQKRHPNPESIRCRQGGRVNCQPCLARFRNEHRDAQQAGEMITGWQANRLPVGSQIRFHECNPEDPVWTKTEDTDYDPEWTVPGQVGWPINEADCWLVVFIPRPMTPRSP